jgi:hypothetical protein
MAKHMKDLQVKMSPESRARSEATAERLIREMASAVSKLERRVDRYVSTLRHFIEVMGGSLEIRAVFPDDDVRITQFRALAAPGAEPDSGPSSDL